MAVRPHGSGFRVDVTVQGQRAPRVTVPTRQEAEKLEAHFKAQLLNGVCPTVPTQRVTQKTTLGDLLDYCVRRHWAGMKAAETQSTNARLVVDYLGHLKDVSTVTPTDLEDYAEYRTAKGKKAGTVNRNLAAFSVLLKTAERLGHIDKAPRIKLLKEYEGRLRWFSDKEETSLLTYLKAHNASDLKDMVVVGFDTGFRQREILDLTPRDWNASTGKITVWVTKGNTARSIKATSRVAAIMDKRSRNPIHGKLFPQISRKSISWRMRRWKEHENLPSEDDLCFHSTRHTFATRLVAAGVTLPAVQRLMGHADLQTTMRYAHLAPDHCDVAISVLEAQRHAAVT